MKIESVSATTILSSQANETIKTTVHFESGLITSASVPAGISSGKNEVKKVPVGLALQQINQINEIVRGIDLTQVQLDDQLSKGNFAGNATLGVSAAFWVAEQQNNNNQPRPKTFPRLMVLLFEGAKHGNPQITIQEFMVICPTIREAVENYKSLEKVLHENSIEAGVGREGAFSPEGFDNSKCLETIKSSLPKAKIALDVAESHGEAILDYQKLLDDYDIFSVEDPLSEDGWAKWVEFNSQFGHRIKIIADDLTTSNPEFIKKAVDLKAANGVIIKPDQIGTISATLEAVKQARRGNFTVVVSHRGDDTNDHWLADLAVFVHADYVKFGGMCRGERIAKYNRLRELGME